MNNISPTAIIKASDVTKGIDMTLEHNRTFRDFNFFEKLK
ncbi:hypothetical protein STRDD10_01643 [Streptococcus sp. DD10]|nr:hypothetical protein STRDD10_01643 [Streptococcus sp. DD10]